jgi:hypothetical protein
MRHNTTYTRFAARSDQKSATEYDGFEYVAIPVKYSVLLITLRINLFHV